MFLCGGEVELEVCIDWEKSKTFYTWCKIFRNKVLQVHSLKKEVVTTGLEPATLGLLDQCSTN